VIRPLYLFRFLFESSEKGVSATVSFLLSSEEFTVKKGAFSGGVHAYERILEMTGKGVNSKTIEGKCGNESPIYAEGAPSGAVR